ncbi:MAG: hypothetical protein BTN85_0243 [Candidatus Methanohalarchaeum thermophilum]|uniref:Uncharacterized protein n=1 Tax=Methanohalarchaeum thermophilum TaxID=1903181 RepID=A0A1Q6DTS8_METT1|nr:MAG: hypothetical protein BTN85_0243 [Candidatus Methanohalarchaeum thermophilum]
MFYFFTGAFPKRPCIIRTIEGVVPEAMLRFIGMDVRYPSNEAVVIKIKIVASILS